MIKTRSVLIQFCTVTPAYQEPVPGWVDNLNGPVGIMSKFYTFYKRTFDKEKFLVAASKGVLRTLLCNGEYSGECIPVDFAINGLIGITKSVASMKEK